MAAYTKNRTNIDHQTIITGGEIQTVPTSGTTTVTKEMADIVSQSLGIPLTTTKTTIKEMKK